MKLRLSAAAIFVLLGAMQAWAVPDTAPLQVTYYYLPG